MSTLFQTLEDRDNVDYVEANGPFPGNIKDRWLGNGYYYWDSFIDLAHFWGRVSYLNHGRNYIIAESKVNLSVDNTLNLLDIYDLTMFKTWTEEFRKTFPNTRVTVEKIITHAENIMGDKFPYSAIRAVFNDCINLPQFQNRIPTANKSYLDLLPPIQICIRSKSLIGKNNFKVIYPPHYTF